MGLEIIGKDEPLSWNEFENHIKEEIKEAKKAKEGSVTYHSPWIFRGHSNSTWPLETSLERYYRIERGIEEDKIEAKKYYQYLAKIVPAINSLTKQNFERFSAQSIKYKNIPLTPQYELMSFARHHGFPTPILDWSKSYFVAAFFAYRDANKNQNIAIYSYKEWSGEARSWIADNPLIHEQGPYIEAHERHFRQQSSYTVCHTFNNEEMIFLNHEFAVEKTPQSHKIKKYILNSDEKNDILEMLFSMNINDYTLFGDTESLLNMLAFKEFRDL